MQSDSAYTIFILFGVLWVVMGTVAVIALLKADNQPIRFGKSGLLVAVPIIIPIIVALFIAASIARS
ncbi:MAG TPA: hypothetical protein V6D10_02335 [Trichocoleus sp.]|jgi:heme/copper-type cytochrome/quinol oxidase subunit 2